MENPVLDRFLTVPEVARLTRLGRNQIVRAIRAGELHPVVLVQGGWPRLSENEIRRWLTACRSTSAATA